MRPKALACAPRTRRPRRTDEHRCTAAAAPELCTPEQSQRTFCKKIKKRMKPLKEVKNDVDFIILSILWRSSQYRP